MPSGSLPFQLASSSTVNQRSHSCLEAPLKLPIQAVTKATGGSAVIASSGSPRNQRATVARRPRRQYASQCDAIRSPAAVSSPAAVAW
jgi:hypothetical protein